MQQTPNMGNPPPRFEVMNDYLIVRKDKMGTDHHLVEMVGNRHHQVVFLVIWWSIYIFLDISLHLMPVFVPCHAKCR